VTDAQKVRHITVVDVRSAMKELINAALLVGLSIKDWRVWKEGEGYLIEYTWPGHSQITRRSIGSTAKEATNRILEIKTGILLVYQVISVKKVESAFKAAMVELVVRDRHIHGCRTCLGHMHGVERDWCDLFKRKQEVIREGLLAAGITKL